MNNPITPITTVQRIILSELKRYFEEDEMNRVCLEDLCDYIVDEDLVSLETEVLKLVEHGILGYETFSGEVKEIYFNF